MLSCPTPTPVSIWTFETSRDTSQSLHLAVLVRETIIQPRTSFRHLPTDSSKASEHTLFEYANLDIRAQCAKITASKRGQPQIQHPPS